MTIFLPFSLYKFETPYLLDFFNSKYLSIVAQTINSVEENIAATSNVAHSQVKFKI